MIQKLIKVQGAKDEERGPRIQGIQDSSARRRAPRIIESLHPIRLLPDTSGQVMVLGLVVTVAMLAFMLTIPNVTRALAQKTRAQTAADAGAFTGSIWLARTLNLSANMNIGIRSVYTWMTVLTVGSALAQALYSDSLDPSVRTMGQEVCSALFGDSSPVHTSAQLYPLSIQQLAETAQWLSNLQDDIAVVFPALAQTLGSEQARRNASGGNPSSENPGGMVLVRTNDTMLVEDPTGDSLMYSDLLRLGASLQVIPTSDSNIGPATGAILVDSHNFEIKAYYGDSSNWYDVMQWAHYYMDYIQQIFQDTRNGRYDTGYRFFEKPGTRPWNDYKNVKLWPNPRQPGDSWVSRYDTTAIFHILDAQPGNNKYKIDTCVYATHRVPKWLPIGPWDWIGYQTGDSTLPLPELESLGLVYDSSKVIPTGFYTGADSTNGHQGPKLRLRRLNPGREFHTVCYVWWLEAGIAPRGLGSSIGGSLFPRSYVAAACPLVAVARSIPYLAAQNPTAEDSYFSPSWDVKLTPLDSAGVQDICNDATYDTLSLDSINLEDLRRYVLLP